MVTFKCVSIGVFLDTGPLLRANPDKGAKGGFISGFAFATRGGAVIVRLEFNDPLGITNGSLIFRSVSCLFRQRMHKPPEAPEAAAV